MACRGQRPRFRPAKQRSNRRGLILYIAIKLDIDWTLNVIGSEISKKKARLSINSLQENFVNPYPERISSRATQLRDWDAHL